MDAVLIDGYGSGPSAKAPLGWVRAYSGANKRAFRNDPANYSGEYVRFDDTNAQFVLVDGYETLSDIDQPDGKFWATPSAWAKSSAASSATREWIVIGTAKIFYVMIKANGAQWLGFFVGDASMLGPNDNLSFAYGLSAAATGYSNSTYVWNSTNQGSAIFARSSANVPGQGRAFLGAALFSGSSVVGGGGLAYPLSTTGGLLLSPMVLLEGGNARANPPRAHLPGVWWPEHANLPEGHVFTDVTGLPPGTELLCLVTDGPRNARALFDMTNDW